MNESWDDVIDRTIKDLELAFPKDDLCRSDWKGKSAEWIHNKLKESE